MGEALLQIRGLRKAYSVAVLRGVDLDIQRGEVHALMGANGAGKSTLCNVIAGQVGADGGTLEFKSTRYEPISISHANTCGVRMVMQELQLVDNLTIAENVFLADFPHRAGFINFSLMNKHCNELLSRFGLNNIDATQRVNTLGIGQQQLVEIARVLNHPCELLILDEPTAALNEEQVELLFSEIAKLRDQGTAIIYVSHRMDEISRIADRVTVLRDGQSVATEAIEQVSRADLIGLMTDSSTATSAGFDVRKRGPVALRVENLSTRHKLSGISIDIHEGQILGVAGLMGSGRTELLRAIFGADPCTQGQFSIGPELRPVALDSPGHAVECGIGMISEDRKQQGLMLNLSIAQNVTISSLARYSNAFGWLNSKALRQEVEQYVDSLNLEYTGIEQNVKELSGGHQQKVILARWLLMDSRVLLFDEPTRGIDIQTKELIYSLLDDLARKGKAIVVVSSESSELFTLCDRIAVLSNGQLAEVFGREDWTPEAITAASFRHYSHAE